MRSFFVIFFSLTLSVGAQELGDLDYVFTSLKKAAQHPEVVYHLDLSKHKLVDFPENMAEFTKLKKLDLSKNKISLLPASVGELKSLEELNLSKNKIYKLPPQLKNLKHLKILLLARNEVEEIPAEIGEMESLETIDLWSNNVKKIDSNIQKLSSLKLLDVRGMLLSDKVKKELMEWLPETTIHFSGGCDCGF